MIINDSVYGEVEIDSKVLIELIGSPSIQRLKGISQLGLPTRLYFKDVYSRYEHSLGVMILLKMLGASEEEQVAGLLHDVSHTAFSHVVDWVVGSGEREDFQDLNHESYISRSELPAILEKHSFDTSRIVNHQLFSLLEQDAPDLCADRVDYTLREWVGEEKMCYKNVEVRDGRMVFGDEPSALKFGRIYTELQSTDWGSTGARHRYQTIAFALNRAMRLGIIQFDDFWKDDEYILERLQNSRDEQILKCIEILSQKDLSWLPTTEEVAHHKFRHIDPMYIRADGSLGRLSENVSEYFDELEQARSISERGNNSVDLERCLKDDA